MNSESFFTRPIIIVVRWLDLELRRGALNFGGRKGNCGMEWNAAAGMNNVGVANGSNLHRRDAVVKLRQGR